VAQSFLKKREQRVKTADGELKAAKRKLAAIKQEVKYRKSGPMTRPVLMESLNKIEQILEGNFNG